jgi:hypothetical protein
MEWHCLPATLQASFEVWDIILLGFPVGLWRRPRSKMRRFLAVRWASGGVHIGV